MPPLNRPKIIIPEKKALHAMGITCGIGSMLVGARQAGFKVVGNVEWRRYYHRKDSEGRNTFTENFPGAFMVQFWEELTEEQINSIVGTDVVYGHPECGCYSQLNSMNHCRTEKKFHEDPGDIPLFVQLVARVKPRFFVMDDLPKSFIAFSMSKYHDLLPEYDLWPEWVSNAGYGNVQKNRKRMFMLGSLKSERWVFKPGEFVHEFTVADVIGDLYGRIGEVPNHDPHTLEGNCQRGLSMNYIGHRPIWKEVKDWISARPEGSTFFYHANDGTVKRKPGMAKNRWRGHAFVLDGASPQFHPLTNLPLSIRERARLQGFPDDFIFYGIKINPNGTWNHEKNNDFVKQTGKAMPIQFNQYIGEAIRSAIEKTPFTRDTGLRVLVPNPFVDDAKRWYCENVGYSDQEGACHQCWMRDTCEIRVRKYGGQVTAAMVRPFAPARRVTRTPLKTVVPPKEVEVVVHSKKPRPPVVTRPKSPLNGKRPGVGKRMAELLRDGMTTDEVLTFIRCEFPESRATSTDVGIIRKKVANGRL